MTPEDPANTPRPHVTDEEVTPAWSAVGAHWPGSLMETMGMEVLENTAHRTVVVAPVQGNRQSAGILHGGASAALAETAASLATQVHAHELWGEDAHAVGVELSVSHLRAARGGRVRAVATALHLGRTSSVHLVEVLDDEDRLVASARVSNRILTR